MPVVDLDPNVVSQFREALSKSQHILVLAGAGLSAASGIPTFRDKEGLWNQHDPHQLSTVAAWKRSPSTVWKWFHKRRTMVREARPNAAHYALAQLSLDTYRKHIAPNSDINIVTQNIDGLGKRSLNHIAPSIPPNDLPYPIEMHGALADVLCTDYGCQHRETNDTYPLVPAFADPQYQYQSESEKAQAAKASNKPTPSQSHFNAVKARLEGRLFSTSRPEISAHLVRDLNAEQNEIEALDSILTATSIPLEQLPRCSKCGALARPAVTFFGENPDQIDEIMKLVQHSDMCIVVGTSSTVYPAATFAPTVRSNGGRVAVFNLSRTKADEQADFSFFGPCEETLPAALNLHVRSREGI